MKKVVFFAFCLIILFSGDVFARGHSSHSSGGSYHSRSSGSSHHSVHVSSYTKKNGSVVRAHTRSASGGSVHVKSYSRKSGAVQSHTRSYPGAKRDIHGKIKRSAAARHAFMKSHPCPSTGKPSGACPGYVIDHIKALKHGGADEPSNMQWQTKAEAKTKDSGNRTRGRQMFF